MLLKLEETLGVVDRGGQSFALAVLVVSRGPAPVPGNKACFVSRLLVRSLLGPRGCAALLC